MTRHSARSSRVAAPPRGCSLEPIRGCWWWLAKVQPKVKDGVFHRTAELVLNNEMQFQLLWSRGILTLYAKLPDGAERVATRRDDWREFVRSLRSEVTP